LAYRCSGNIDGKRYEKQQNRRCQSQNHTAGSSFLRHSSKAESAEESLMVRKRDAIVEIFLK